MHKEYNIYTQRIVPQNIDMRHELAQSGRKCHGVSNNNNNNYIC